MKTVSSVILFLIISSANAELSGVFNIQSSGPFYLQDGVVPPKNGLLRISFDSLPIEMTYIVTCDIENPNWNKPYPIVISTYTTNGVTLPYLLNQQITKYSNRIRIGYGSTGGRWPRDFSFINHDDTDSAYIKNCMAIYATN